MTTLKKFALLAVLLSLSVLDDRAADPVYENIGEVTVAPQIDALSFLNSGSFSVSSALPFETQNTRSFVNTGTMTGSPGFRFETISSGGARGPATSFLNDVDAQVFATTPGRILLSGSGAVTGSGFENPQIIISALSVTNRGRLHADADGLVRIQGNTVDLSRSSVGILPYSGGAGFLTETNFVPEVGIFDSYWGMNGDGSASFRPAGMALANRGSTNFTVATPPHSVTNEFRPRGFRASLRLTNAIAYVMTNAISPSNLLVQAVFVQVNDPELAVDVKFADSTILTNLFKTAVVQFSHPETNVLAGGKFLTQLYLLDRAASETNFVLLTNLVTQTTMMPSNYEVTRLMPLEFALGAKANATNFSAYTNLSRAMTNLPNVLHNGSYSNAVVTNVYSAYQFNVTNVSAVLPDLPGASMTNLPGRIEITANELNLNRTRIRGEGIVSVKAKKLIGTNSVFDVQNLALDLQPTDGNLVIRDLAPDKIERLTGLISAWTCVWTNQVGQRTITPDPADPTLSVTNDLPIDINFHVLVVDSSPVLTRLDGFLANFTARSTNVVIADTIRVRETLLVDAENLTLAKTFRTFPASGTNAAVTITNLGKIIMTNSPGTANLPVLRDWNTNSFPKLRNLTNEGLIRLPGSARFGTEGSRPYVSVVNRGSIVAYDQGYRSGVFYNSGTITNLLGAGPITVEATTATLTNGLFAAGGNIEISANDLLMRGYTNRTPRSFVLSLANSVSDGGRGASNLISCQGFQLLAKPKTGDLFGTTVESVAPLFLAVPHVWAGENRGPTRAGFTNNVTLGRLVLKTALDSLHSFAGPTTNNALYVDFLEIQGPGTNDVESALEIRPGFTLYFADSNLAADRLNGKSGGRLVWVKDFVGPNSVTSVLVGGADRVVLMNRALRLSTTIDTDGDGVVNAEDPSPRDDMNQPPMVLRDITVSGSPPTVSFSWEANPKSVYRVEYATSLINPDWRLLLNYTNSSSSSEAAIVKDLAIGEQQRFYRVLSGR